MSSRQANFEETLSTLQAYLHQLVEVTIDTPERMVAAMYGVLTYFEMLESEDEYDEIAFGLDDDRGSKSFYLSERDFRGAEIGGPEDDPARHIKIDFGTTRIAVMPHRGRRVSRMGGARVCAPARSWPGR